MLQFIIPVVTIGGLALFLSFEGKINRVAKVGFAMFCIGLFLWLGGKA